MKSLGLAFAILAVAGSAVYFLFGYLLHAGEYAAGLAALLFGALPILHQELEKRTTSGASGIVSQPGPMNSPETQTVPDNSQASTFPVVTIPATTAPPPAPLAPSAATSAANPTPVYVSSIPAPVVTNTPAETPLPSTQATASMATAGASAAQRPTNWFVIFVYSLAIVIAVRGASDFTRLIERWYEGLPGDGLEVVYVFIGSWLPVLIVGVGVFLVGLWVGRKSPRMGWLLTIGAVVLGLLLARLINMVVNYDETNAFVNDYLLPRDQASVDWRFANPDDYDRLYLSLSWAFTLGLMVLESVVALAGYWIGKRLKSSRASQ